MEWFIVPKKVEQINDHLFIDTYKSNNIKIGVYDMTVNDSEMCVRWKKYRDAIETLTLGVSWCQRPRSQGHAHDGDAEHRRREWPDPINSIAIK